MVPKGLRLVFVTPQATQTLVGQGAVTAGRPLVEGPTSVAQTPPTFTVAVE